MRKWYCVTTTFDNKGKVTANITDVVETDKCPENTYDSTSEKDIYNDWFDEIEKAEKWVQDSKRA